MLINVLVLWKAIDYAIKRYICRVTASSILSHFRSFFFFRQSSRYYEGSDFDIFGRRLLCCLGSGRSCWPLHPKLRSCWSVSSLGCMPWPTCLHFPAWCVSKKKISCFLDVITDTKRSILFTDPNSYRVHTSTWESKLTLTILPTRPPLLPP